MNLKEKVNFKKFINYKISDNTAMKVKSVRVLIYFFIIMLVFTVLSRFSDSLTIPRVTVTKGFTGTIDSEIIGDGQIVQSKEEHLEIMENLKIDSVNVIQGQEIKAGDLLFTISLKDIDDKASVIEKQIAEIDKGIIRATEDYSIALERENKIITSAKKAMDYAKEACDNAESEDKEILKADYEQKKSIYDDAVSSKEGNLLTYLRAIEDAKNEIERGKLQESLSKLQNYKTNEGKVTASKDAIVTTVNVQAGEIITQTQAISMADESEGNQFVCFLPKDYQKKIKLMQDVTIKSSSGRTTIDGLKIDSIRPALSDPNSIECIVKLPKGKGKVGEFATLSIQDESKKYNVCVPINAIHMEGDNIYVFIVNKVETVLREEEVACKVKVQIGDKNNELVGIKDGTLKIGDEVIISSNKEIRNGDRVRKESQ